MAITEVIKNLFMPNRFEGMPPDVELRDPAIGDLSDGHDYMEKLTEENRADLASGVSHIDVLDVPGEK